MIENDKLDASSVWHRFKGWNADIAFLNNSNAFVPLVFPRAFSEKDCDHLLAQSEGFASIKGETVGLPEGYRKCRAQYLTPSSDTKWVADRIEQIFVAANEHLGFSLSGLVEPLQVVTYGPGDKFDWHSDCGPSVSASRKLSLSVQLSPRDRYHGGELDFISCEVPGGASEQGSAVVFASFLVHKVREISSGTRCALISWAYGSTFR